MAKRDCKSEPRATEAPQPTTRCGYYSRAVHNAIFLRGEWIPLAGFTDGMPIKIRVMPDCSHHHPEQSRAVGLRQEAERDVCQQAKDAPVAGRVSGGAERHRRSAGNQARGRHCG